jgi:ribosomal protein S18 acetylase RimI-like enzyme
MKSKNSIRLAINADAAQIAQVGRIAFTDSFGPFNSEEDLASHLDGCYQPHLIESEIATGCRYLVAEVDSCLAGFAKLRESEPPSCIPGRRPFEVHQIYLLAKFHRRGIGSELIKRGAELVRESGGDGIFLGVYEKADWGISFYQSCGFRKVGEHVFRVGQDDQTDWLMYLQLLG